MKDTKIRYRPAELQVVVDHALPDITDRAKAPAVPSACIVLRLDGPDRPPRRCRGADREPVLPPAARLGLSRQHERYFLALGAGSKRLVYRLDVLTPLRLPCPRESRHAALEVFAVSEAAGVLGRVPPAVSFARKGRHMRVPDQQQPVWCRHLEALERLPPDHCRDCGDVLGVGQRVAQDHRRPIVGCEGRVLERLKAHQGRESQRLDLVGLNAPRVARCPRGELLRRAGQSLVEPLLQAVGDRREAQQRRWLGRPPKGDPAQRLAAFPHREPVGQEVAGEPA